MDLTTHPFLNIIWSFFIIFIWFAWFMLLFRIIADVFRRHDIGGGMKAVWTILVIFLPLLGSLIYLISQGNSMASRDMEQARAAQSQIDNYIPRARRQRRRSSGDRAREGPARLRRDRPGGVPGDQGEGSRLRAVGATLSLRRRQSSWSVRARSTAWRRRVTPSFR